MSACHKIESKRFCFGYYYYRTFKIGIETWSFLLTSLLQREKKQQSNASKEKMNARLALTRIICRQLDGQRSSVLMISLQEEGGQELMLLLLSIALLQVFLLPIWRRSLNYLCLLLVLFFAISIIFSDHFLEQGRLQSIHDS